jgi:hypothetical protein
VSDSSDGMQPFGLAPEFGSAGPPDYDAALDSYLEYVTELFRRRLAEEGMPSLRESDRHRERLTGG